MAKKGQGLTLNTVIIAALVVIVLCVLVGIFTGYWHCLFSGGGDCLGIDEDPEWIDECYEWQTTEASLFRAMERDCSHIHCDYMDIWSLDMKTVNIIESCVYEGCALEKVSEGDIELLKDMTYTQKECVAWVQVRR